jgi:hypothetical protein
MDRPPPRAQGWRFAGMKVTDVDVTEREASLACAVIGEQSGYIIGRGIAYDPLKDEFHVTGKDFVTGAIRDDKIPGELVGTLVLMLRSLKSIPETQASQVA